MKRFNKKLKIVIKSHIYDVFVTQAHSRKQICDKTQRGKEISISCLMKKGIGSLPVDTMHFYNLKKSKSKIQKTNKISQTA